MEELQLAETFFSHFFNNKYSYLRAFLFNKYFQMKNIAPDILASKMN